MGRLGGEDETREGQIWKDFICQIEEFPLSPSGVGLNGRFSDKKVKGSDLYLGRVTLEARRKYSKREALEGWGHREAMFQAMQMPSGGGLGTQVNVGNMVAGGWGVVVVVVRGHVGLCFRSQLESESYRKTQCLDTETGILSTSYCLYFVFTNFM